MLPVNIVLKILHIYNCREYNGGDKAIWKLSKDGTFSVKSAYIENIDADFHDKWKWRFNWKLRVPPKICFFLLTLLHGKLLTNLQRMIRGITLDDSCFDCGESCEDLNHLFRQCTTTIETWKSCWVGMENSWLFIGDWEEWILNHLKNNTMIPVLNGKCPSSVWFAFILWFIWKWRCKKIFDPNFCPPPCIQLYIMKYVHDWVNASNNAPLFATKHPLTVCWSPPPSTWVKVNVDGSHRCNSNLIAVGGVIRNSERGWLAGFATKKGAGSVLGAELWGIIEGLKLAWSSGCNKVIVETDSLEAVESLSTSNIC
ncbi:hypothetical protein ACOSP7_013101 [Xanthoceras sorbifolium]